ncbi:phosphonate C-P lyase system protein PhnH [Pollutimonas harenae]|uniref:Phosphonate C-P lyase system protein PhnH n=1 Tax=Pollutimonas harenae TaxID=657015 RepID=A0A853H1D7_9BURK|nr:phosphonate C-P lyase system protein PhnH [Pollutimonas harenae]NYT85840.1 phosphonate C-P lyase system protein PhnH [Pollutimonas harenae]TEA70898.1 phosphonate C-P lyase system protein PhnH [Pollutimonas harenae]
MENQLLPAFAEPVHTAQQVFRQALSALSEPGQPQTVSDAPGLGGLASATYALCLSLLDSDTPLWLSPSLDTPVVRANLSFHCGCPIVDEPKSAAFAILDGKAALDISRFNPGNDRDPHLSCTVMIQLDSLEGGPATAWRGPGILNKQVVNLPVPTDFWAQRTQYDFPIGIDLFLTADCTLLGLPRSTKVLPMIQEVI